MVTAAQQLRGGLEKPHEWHEKLHVCDLLPFSPGTFYLNLPAKPESRKELGLMVLSGLQPFKGTTEKQLFISRR